MNTTKTQHSCTTISLLNMKGGVGKTTLAVNLACALAFFSDKRVLLIDLDPQFNASQWLLEAEQWDQHRKKNGTIADVLIEPSKPVLNVRARKKETLSTLKRAIVPIIDYQDGSKLHFIPSELNLARAIKAPAEVPYKLEKGLIEVRPAYDYIIIDCAPTDSILTDTALMASEFVLVPMRPDRFSVLGYAQIGEALANFRDKFPDPHSVQDLGVVFTMVSGNSSLESECMREVSDQAGYVFRTQIGSSRSFVRAVKEHSPVYFTRHTRGQVKAQIISLVHEMEERVEQIRTQQAEVP